MIALPRFVLSVLTAFPALATSLVIPALNAQDTAPKPHDYWGSVYAGESVLSIELNMTREAWDEMMPARQQRGPGRGRGGPPPGRGGPPGQGGRSGGPPGGERGGPPVGGAGGPPGMGGDSDYTYVKASITIDGEAFPDAGLRFKGNSSFRSSEGSNKRPLKIDLNRFVEGQELHGRSKFNLSIAMLDSAFMKEALGSSIYEAAGVPAPGTGWATVTLTVDGLVDKEPLGIYVLVEQVSKGFIKRRFGKDSKGSLLLKPDVGTWEYAGDTPADYEAFGIKDGEDDAEQFAAFTQLLKWLESASDDEFAAGIAERVDLDNFAGYLAATSALSSIDSYVGMPHNYYLLLDRADGKLKILPWDLNEVFGTFAMGTRQENLVRWDIDRPWTAQRPFLERLFATEAFPKIYRAALEGLVAGAFRQEPLFAQIAKMEKTLRPFASLDPDGPGLAGMKMGIEGDDDGFNAAVQRRTFAIKPFIEKRIESIRAQLAGEEEGEVITMRRRR